MIDFGLSRHDQLPDLVQEEAEGPVGTGAYISPEQVLGDRSDPRSDIFALGVILYLSRDRRASVRRAAARGKWRRRLWRDPVPPRGWNADVPPWLQEVILRCLEVDPDARYATAAQLAFDSATSRPGRPDRTGRAHAARWLSYRRLALVTASTQSAAAATPCIGKPSRQRTDRPGRDRSRAGP